jgi:hypothetical protein
MICLVLLSIEKKKDMAAIAILITDEHKSYQ